MEEGYLGSIMIWTQKRIPRGWMLCDGRVLQIAQNQALFALLGIQYGGDGRTTFALPDLLGRTVVGAGVYNNQVVYTSGNKGGLETSTINNTQMPSHTHSLMGNKNSAANPASVPTNNLLGVPGTSTSTSSINLYAQPNNPTNITPLAPESITQSGTGAAHSNMQPYMALNYIICVQGIFPPRQ